MYGHGLSYGPIPLQAMQGVMVPQQWSKPGANDWLFRIAVLILQDP